MKEDRIRTIVKIKGDVEYPGVEATNYIVTGGWNWNVWDKEGNIICLCNTKDQAKRILNLIKKENR